MFEPVLLPSFLQAEPHTSASTLSHLLTNDHLTLSKRFYAILRPLRLREAHLGTNAEQATLTLAKPAGTTEARTHLRRLSMVVFADFSPLHALTLSQLDHTQS